MSGTILFKFRNARGEPETVTFDGIHITAVELKNLIAEKKGLTDGTLELSDPKTKSVFDDSHVFPRGSAVTVRRVAASKAQTRAQQAAANVDTMEEVTAGPAMAALQTLAATRASAAQSVDPSDENAQLEQRKANLGKEDAEIGLLVNAQDEAWRAQSDKNILATRAREQQLAAQRGRGRGFGSSFMHGRGRGTGAQPTGFCKFCGKMNDHYSDDCPQKHNPRTDLRHVRTPAGIPSELLEQTSEGGLLLNTGKTGALKSSTGLAAQAFAALPTAAKRAPPLPALTDAPHEQQGEQQHLLLENGNQQKHLEEQEDAEAAGLDKLDQEDALQMQEPVTTTAEGPSAAAAAAADDTPTAAAVDVDMDDAYLFDDDFGFSTAKDINAAGGLFEDDVVLPANGVAAQLKLGLGMELPEPQQQPGGDSQRQRLQGSSSPLKQQQPPSPVQQSPGGKGQEDQQQTTPAGLKPVDPLQYCNDIILANVPDAGRWALKDIKQAFIHERPLTPDEFSALLVKYQRPPPAVVPQKPQQQQQQQPDEGARRRHKEASNRRRSRSKSPVRGPSPTHSRSRDRSGKRQRKADKSPRSRRSRSRSRSTSRDRRSKHRISRNKRDMSVDRSRDERTRGNAPGSSIREQQPHEQQRGQREVKSAMHRSASPAQEEAKVEQAGDAKQGIDRRADLTASAPSQDLKSLLEENEQQQQQPAGNKPSAATDRQRSGGTSAADTASPQPDVAAAHVTTAAATANDGPAAAEKPSKRRPIADRLGPQPRSPVRSPTPEPQQQQQETETYAPQQPEQAGPVAEAANRSRSHSSHDRSSSRSLSGASGSARRRQRSLSRSKSRGLSADSRGRQRQQQQHPEVAAAPADEEEEEEEKLDFGDEADEQEGAAAAQARGSYGDMSEDEARASRRHKHRSSKRSKRSKKEKKEKKEKRKRHRSDKHWSRSQSRSRSRSGRRRRHSRSRSPSRSRSLSRDRSRSLSHSRSRSRPRGRTPESPPAKRSRSNIRAEGRKSVEPAPRESIASRLGTRAVAAAGVTAEPATRSTSGRLIDADKRPAPAGGAGRLLGRAFQNLGGASSSRSQAGRSAVSGEHGEGSKRSKR